MKPLRPVRWFLNGKAAQVDALGYKLQLAISPAYVTGRSILRNRTFIQVLQYPTAVDPFKFSDTNLVM